MVLVLEGEMQDTFILTLLKTIDTCLLYRPNVHVLVGVTVK